MKVALQSPSALYCLQEMLARVVSAENQLTYRDKKLIFIFFSKAVASSFVKLCEANQIE